MAASRTAVAVVLAAGGGSRFHGAQHKLMTDFRGRPLVAWSLEHALAAGLARTWVVTGAIDLVAVGVVPKGIEVLINRRWADGQASSLQVAVRAARALAEGPAGASERSGSTGAHPAGRGGDDLLAAPVGCMVIGLGDQPLLSPAVWKAVAESSGRPVAVATFGGRRRNPVRIDRECWDLLPTDGDAGARVLMRERPDLVMEVPCQSDPIDIDTLEDLRRASQWSGRS